MSKCSRCGQCCTFSNGAPFLYPADLDAWLRAGQWHILKHVRFTVDKDKKTQEWTFDEVPHTHKCVFLREAGCAIYRSRPLACQVYPADGSVPVCYGGVLHARPGKALIRRFRRAWKEWERADLSWRQETLKTIRFEAQKHG